MSSDETNHDEACTEAGSEAAQGDEGGAETVFGNLPTTRPGGRSPRRAADRVPSPPTPGPATGKPADEASAAAARSDRPEPSGGAPPEPAGGGVEDVAWAGVAAAAEAATIGVRLATRALEAMRDAVDRR